ncbi:DUF4406 domain-containing protein [Paraburkholderia tropica]|uniref:DUF4406 domain-containing protein n=1 Tax=Paraburkholderia tropica TaxID=92647 RepID=UPI0007EC4AD1|nr:DUF4406 domain-containing protein [Paraburkholderia tropica]OBR52354.1 hypothetical protein A6456_10670 [Paraburkholderia tropica]
MKKAYLSGPMTGLPNLNFPAFNRAAVRLRNLRWEVVNPVAINPDPAADWLDCIAADLLAMRDCTAIVLLPGWSASFGARIERLAAERMGLEIFNLSDLVGEEA